MNFVRLTDDRRWAVLRPTHGDSGWYVAAIHDTFDQAADDAAKPSPFDMIADPPIFRVPQVVLVGEEDE